MSQIPETRAAERIAAAIAPHLHPAWLTERFFCDIAGKVVAHRDFIRGVFAELDADPGCLPERGDVLRRQSIAQTEDADFFLEQAHYHLRGYREACGVLSKMGVHRDLYDPQERADREDDRRVSQVLADDEATTGMPRGMAS